MNGTRREVDVERVRRLAVASRGRIGIVTLPAAGRPRFVLDLGYATVGSQRYPTERQAASRIAIDLAPRHPFQAPVTTVLTPVFHPHVFDSGVVCIGAKWLSSEGMDLFVLRVVRLLAFDPLLMNPFSIANGAANAWYQATLRRHPDAFPTDPEALALTVDEPLGQRARAHNAPAASGERVIRQCPHCRAGLRLPAGQSGMVRCPACGREFRTNT
jgi:hypothetical protein